MIYLWLTSIVLQVSSIGLQFKATYIENITWLRGNMKFISSVNEGKFTWKVCIYV